MHWLISTVHTPMCTGDAGPEQSLVLFPVTCVCSGHLLEDTHPMDSSGAKFRTIDSKKVYQYLSLLFIGFVHLKLHSFPSPSL